MLTGVVLLLLSAGCHERLTGKQAEVSLAAEEVLVLERTEALGRQIYAQDQYAGKATNLLLGYGVDLTEMGTRGWITENQPDGCVVTFVGGDPESWRSVCVVTFVSDDDPNVILVDKDLSETQAAMFNARQLALSTVQTPCSDAYNTAVIPREDGPGWLAYALAATRDPNLLLVGGHYRATVSADGKTVLEQRSFTKDCLVLKRLEGAGSDGDAAAYTVGHILDNRPTEIHVFLNLLCGKPLYVVTGDGRFWRVEGGRVRLLKQP